MSGMMSTMQRAIASAESALAIDTELVTELLTGFIREEVGKTGFNRVVVGTSGGVDSSLVVALAVRALGPEQVVPIVMPYRSSDPQSEADARLLCSGLGVEPLVIDITPQVDAYFDRFPDADRRRRGNKMARERMTILFDQSAMQHALVLGTSNKTEMLIGYSTLFGDQASALNPIGDLYKTQVFALSRAVGVPERIVSKAPSADLWAGQSDEDEMGITYSTLDTVLFHLVDERRTRDELAAM